jgi:hypothetical protein
LCIIYTPNAFEYKSHRWPKSKFQINSGENRIKTNTFRVQSSENCLQFTHQMHWNTKAFDGQWIPNTFWVQSSKNCLQFIHQMQSNTKACDGQRVNSKKKIGWNSCKNEYISSAIEWELSTLYTPNAFECQSYRWLMNSKYIRVEFV